jgi:tRNA U34 5-methylaminomethyl-2-thiouridine-forming methyltransferase MnmC
VNEEYAPLNYAKALGKKEMGNSFQMLHKVSWNKTIRIGNWFTLVKHHIPVEQFVTSKKFHVIFYDAFMPVAQPEMWTEESFARMYNLLLPNGVLTTYCSKAEVRRNLEAAGFFVEKLPGPLGKREMLRARKPS